MRPVKWCTPALLQALPLGWINANAPKAAQGIRGAGEMSGSGNRSASGSAAHSKKDAAAAAPVESGLFAFAGAAAVVAGFGAAAAFGFDGVGAHAVRAKDAAEVAAFVGGSGVGGEGHVAVGHGMLLQVQWRGR